MPKENNKVDINKHEIDIDTLFKQNVNDLSAIKELYRKLKEVEEKISQIKYIDSTLAYKLKKEYEKLKKIILDENIQTKLTNDIESINSQLDNKASKIFITPAEFGAIGDGVNDDTQALQNAINYSIQNKIQLYSNSNKVYLITTGIDITGMILLDFSNSTIKINNSLADYVVSISQGSNIGGYIKNLKIDCNNESNNGLLNNYSGETVFENIEIINIKMYGYQAKSGYENFHKQFRLKTELNSETTGLYLHTNHHDNHYDDIIIKDLKIAVNNSYGSNFFNRVHCWNSNANNFSNSIGFVIGGSTNMNDCYIDTYETGITSVSDTWFGDIVCNNLRYTISSSFADDIVTNDIKLFDFKGSVTLTNQIKTLTVYGKGIESNPTKFSDINKEYYQGSKPINFNFINFDNNTIPYSIINSEANVLLGDVALNNITLDADNNVNIELIINNVNIDSSGLKNIALIPSGFRPASESFLICITGSNVYKPTSLMFCSVALSGSLQVNGYDNLGTVSLKISGIYKRSI